MKGKQTEFHVKSAAEAIALCQKLVKEGKADIFRGQRKDWPILPALLRLNAAKKSAAGTRLSDFVYWADNVPQMVRYHRDQTAQRAIAQHYGIATTLIDLTTDPAVALFFAQDGETPTKGEAVIYCLQSRQLVESPDIQLVRIDVENLWRLEAQRGLFIDCLSKKSAKFVQRSAIKVFFKPSINDADASVHIYPNRKSSLELSIDEWLYRNTLENTLAAVSKNATIIRKTKRHTYLGVYRWRRFPELSEEWTSSATAWQLPSVELLESTKNSTEIVLRSIDVTSGAKALQSLRPQMLSIIQGAYSARSFVSIRIEVAGIDASKRKSIAEIFHRSWDGLRSFPYSSAETSSAMVLIAALLLGRSLAGDKVDGWYSELWGETEILEIAPYGGHISAGVVSRDSLISAIATSQFSNMAAHYRRQFTEKPLDIFLYVVDHVLIFKYEEFKKMFCEQYVPANIDEYWKNDLELYEGELGCLWDVSFNPTLLGYVTTSWYRFRSPLGLEDEPNKLIFVTEEMTKDDLTELFAYAVPDVKEDNEPLLVRFHGYGQDSRELWQIPSALSLSDSIVQVGGISVLEVFPNMKTEIKKRKKIGDFPGGLGAFDIWLMSKRLLEKMQGKKVEEDMFNEFWNDLMKSNAIIETLAAQLEQDEKMDGR